MLEIIVLQKSFGSQAVLKGVNLVAKPGTVQGIVGENGAGKSTLFQCIIGLLSYEGAVKYDGKLLKNKLGFLPTTPPMMSLITGYEYLQLVTKARDVQVEDFETNNIFELPLSKYIEHYSTGMKKKIALTGVLLQKNDVFILDEPFNGLDLQSNMILLEVIKRLKAANKMILISSHIFSILKDVCDQIHHLSSGVIKEIITSEHFDQFEENMNAETYKRKINNLEF